MRFDLGTLDSVERPLPFGLLVELYDQLEYFSFKQEAKTVALDGTKTPKLDNAIKSGERSYAGQMRLHHVKSLGEH